MSEINNNNNVNKAQIQKSYEVGFTGKRKDAPEEELALNSKNINDLGNNPADYLGRSQVKKSKMDAVNFNGELAANIKRDLGVMMQNPELVTKSDLMFEKALQKNGYKNAALMQMGMVDELKA